MRQKWKTIPLGILFTSLVGTTVVTTIFLFANKDRPLNSKEQSAIESINELIIKNNDGIDKNINLSLLNPKDVQEKISSYLLKTKKSNKLKVQIKNFKVNFQEGSLQYKIILISNSFPQKEIKVRYAIGTWESESQAFERKQELEYINSLETREDFKKTINNLLKMSKTTVVPDEPPNLGSGIQNFINSHGIISNWNVQIQDYKNDTIFGNLSFMIILSKNYPVVGMRSRKILMKYPSGSFKVDQKKINEIEQLEINKITSDDIKNHDGINKSKNLLLLDQPQGLAEKLKNSVKSLKKFKNWRARISNYKPNQEKGSLEYIVTLTKAGFKQHVIKVLYPDNSFLTIAESNKLKEIEIIKNLNTDSLWANDEIRPETNVDTITKETLKTTLENYVNNIVGVSGWKAEITRFHKNIEERSLTYKVKFTKANFLTSKVITIEYPKNSLANTEIIKKQNEINNELQAIRNFKIIDLKGIDNINPDKKKIAPTEKKDWREELKTKIQNKIQGLELTTHNSKHIQWKVEVSEQIRNPLGSISYTITIESKDYSPLEIKTLPIYYTNEFQSDEEHEWEKEKQLLEEKIKVEDIDIKGNDQINPSKSETPPLEMPTNSNKNIQKHINEQFSRDKDGIQWKTNIINFESNPKEGSVSYKIEIFQERTEDKLKKIGKTLTIDYPAGSFKTEEEVLKEELNNFKKLFTIQEIKKNDGITTTSIYLPSKWKTEGDVLEHLKNKFLTDTNSLKWEKFSILHEILIKDFKPNDTNGSLSYTFVLTPYKEKEIKEKNKMSEYVIKTPISYDAGSFQTLKEYEESKIKKIQAKDLENVDGIIADSSKLPPIKPIDLKSKIEDYVQDQKKLSGWTVTINEYTKDKTTGSLKYTVKFAKNKFTRDILVEYKNKFQTLVQKQQSQLNKLDNSIIKGVDGIVPNLIKWAPSNLEKTIIKENLEKSLAFKKNTDSYYGWQAIISAYTPNHQEGSLSYKLEFQKNTLTTKSFTISYPQNSFKSWSQKEKDRILKLTNKEIRENDGITTKNDKFAPEKDDKLHEKLEDYVNNLDELSGWTAKINSYEVNHKEGKLKYSVTFDQSPQYPPKTLEINYSGFQKLKNFDWQIISNLNLDDLKKWDGIQPNYKTLASTISRDNVKGKLKNEINKIVKNNLEKDNLKNLKTYLDKEKINLPEVEVNFKENNYQADDKKGAISYTIIISRDYSKVDGKIEEKVIEVKYQKYSFRSLDKEEQDTINKIEPSEIQNNDGITADLSDLAPNKPNDLQTKIENYVNAKPNASGWTVIVFDYKKDAKKGSLSYKITLSKKGFQNKELSVSYLDNSFLTSEQDTINKIEPSEIQDNDGIIVVSSKLPPDQTNNLQTKIEGYVKNQKKLSGWKVSVFDYKKDAKKGSLSYKITLSKNGFQDKEVSVSYLDNSFLTLEQDTINKIEPSEIQNNDGITIDKTQLPPARPRTLENTLASFVNDQVKKQGWAAKVSQYTQGEQDGSLSYKVSFSKNGFTGKTVSVKYPAQTFDVISHIKEKEIISKIKPQEIQENDDINPSPEDSVPDKPINIEQKIKDYLKKTHKITTWDVKIDEYKKDTLYGSLSYSIIFTTGIKEDEHKVSLEIQYPEGSFKHSLLENLEFEGSNRQMWEDAEKVLWVASSTGGLNRYDYEQKKWIKYPTDNIDISSRYPSFFFLDSSGNRWMMASQGLMLLKANSQKWEKIDKTISSGGGGSIIEDHNKNLWVLSKDNKLKLLKKEDGQWKTTNVNDSKITDGFYGYLFKDSQNNLWAMGRRYNGLEVLWKGRSEWKEVKVKDFDTGYQGYIFEDSENNLWVWSRKSPLRVLKKGYGVGKVEEDDWINPGKEDLINKDTTIFEDSQKNIWTMGYKKPLQKFDSTTQEWKKDDSSNIKNGFQGTIMEDSNNNLWSMGYGTKLQIRNKGSNKWETVPNSIIQYGQKGFIFEDSSGNIWSAGKRSKLQVFLRNSKIKTTPKIT